MTATAPPGFTGAQFLSLHALDTLVGACPVRDDNNNPKTLQFGGESRHLMTAQNRRRAERTHTRNRANQGIGPLAGYSMGVRTREWALMTAVSLREQGWEDTPGTDALAVARAVLAGCGLNFGAERTENLTKVLIFAPQEAPADIAAVLTKNRQSVEDWIAEIDAKREKDLKVKVARGTKKTAPAEEEAAADTKAPPLPAAVKAGILAALAPADAIDIALYGRFLAEIAQSPNVDGAIQTGPAFTVHALEETQDFYSAADDAKLDRKAAPRPTDALAYLDAAAADSGAGMTGYQTLISGTFYRHAALDRWQLRHNLLASGNSVELVEAMSAAAEHAFIEAFIDAVSASKKNTTAAPGSLPKLVLAFDGDRPFNYANTFERTIEPTVADPSSLRAARRLLAQHRLVTTKRPDIRPGRVLTYDLDVQELLDQLAAEGILVPAQADSVEGLTHP